MLEIKLVIEIKKPSPLSLIQLYPNEWKFARLIHTKVVHIWKEHCLKKWKFSELSFNL